MFAIGIYNEYFQVARNSYNKKFIDAKYKDFDPEKIVFKPNIYPNLENIFNALGIKNRCCRMHLSTGVSTYQ
jgi:DNA-directed RNA polymerase subunit N (RpoN/RPB10)